MNAGEKEVIDLMKEWKDEIKKLTSDYSIAIENLNNARLSYEKSLLRKITPIITPILAAILVVIVAIMLNKNIAWCSFKYMGVELTNQDCQR